MTNEQKIWSFLMSFIHNEFGVAGLMGNLYAESGLYSGNLQNSYEKLLGMTDDVYTASVDNGSYKNFVNDRAGYGLAQWTSSGRKQGLFLFLKSQGKSIADLDGQLAYLKVELETSYKSVLAVLKNAQSVPEASNIVLTKFERPKDQSDSAKQKRASYGFQYFTRNAAMFSALNNAVGAQCPYSVKVPSVEGVPIYKEANGNITGKSTGRGAFTIVEEKRAGGKTFGKLLSGAGWIEIGNGAIRI